MSDMRYFVIGFAYDYGSGFGISKTLLRLRSDEKLSTEKELCEKIEKIYNYKAVLLIAFTEISEEIHNTVFGSTKYIEEAP